jgi:NAD(P)H dehydrogenase (quinone)
MPLEKEGPMRVHYIYCHPLAESFHHAIRETSVAALKSAGHEVDLLDLYAEKFDPVLSAEGRRDYHDTSRNQQGLESYVARLRAAEALVVQFPTWCFGFPAMLKGYFDRLYMPGVAFDISNPADVKPMLSGMRRIVGISTYGRPRWTALYVGDPPRKQVTRYLPRLAAGNVRVSYHALYHMNVASDAKRAAFLAQVGRALAQI